MKQVWSRDDDSVSMVEDDVPTIAEVVDGVTRRYLDDRPQAEKDALATASAALAAEMQAEMDIVSSREIREALTQEERRSLRSSDNLDVQDVYEEVITMGGYSIRRDDPKLAQMLTLVRSVFPEHTFDGLEQLFQST